MKNPRLVKVVELMREASNSAWLASYSASNSRSAWSAYSAYSVYDSACGSACGSASRSAELDEKAVLKIIADKYKKGEVK